MILYTLSHLENQGHYPGEGGWEREVGVDGVAAD